jgi:hypothetical protein
MVWAFAAAAVVSVGLFRGFEMFSGCEQCTPLAQGPVQMVLLVSAVGFVISRGLDARRRARIQRQMRRLDQT